MTWATLSDARAPGLWPDAAGMDDDTLGWLLDVAYETCTEFLGGIGVPAPPPRSYVLANVLQAREVWATFRTGPGGLVAFDNYSTAPAALTARVKQLLRPRRGFPTAVAGPS